MAKLKPPVNEDDHLQGNAHAKVVLVEYGDFECPHCAVAHPIIQQLEKKYKEQMAFVFRHFPLSEIHPFAKIAAISAEAAAKQGKFWEMHNMIFENQTKISTVFLLRIAESLGLDIKIFQRDTYDDKLAEKVDDQFESGVLSGVNGTPSFYINGEKYNGAYDFESMSAAVENAIARYVVTK
jgi:protein-disulfide isomerase